MAALPERARPTPEPTAGMESCRSCLSVPASSPRMLAKAQGIPADAVVIDLEDAVDPAHKAEARAGLLAALEGWQGPRVVVRINAPRTPWCHRDVLTIASLASPVHGIVVPKVEDVGDLAFIDRLLDGAEAESPRARPLRVEALIESAAGLTAVDEIAAGSDRLDALILGYADLTVSLGRPQTSVADLDLWLPAQYAVLTAARAHGLRAIDGPFLDFSDANASAAATRRARDLGFDGKWAIHPSQVAPLNALFAPSDTEVSEALAVIEALERAGDGGAGAVSLNGKMVDEASRKNAERVLERARAN